MQLQTPFPPTPRRTRPPALLRAVRRSAPPNAALAGLAGLLLHALVAATPLVAAQDSATGGEEPAPSLADHPRVVQSLRLLEAWLEAERAYQQIPGLSAAVVHGDELLWSGAFGVADREAGTPATPETVYSICSISKLFTALSVLQLRDAGELSLADPVGEHLPWFTITQAYPEGPPVTVWGLLTHSSGLPRESDFPYWSAPDFDFPTREEIRRRLGEQETLYPAERHFQYSNLGLTLAGEVVAEVSGRPYADYVRDELLDPLGLADTRPEMPDPAEEARLATGYGSLTRQGTREPVAPFHAEGIAPAAGFSSNALDLARFASWQLRILESGGDEVLDGDTLREMQRVQWLEPDWETARGLGFGVYRVNGTTFTGHSGSCPGYRSTVWIQPDDRIGTAALANASGVATERFVRRAHEIVAAAVGEAEGDESPRDGEDAEEADPSPLPEDGTDGRTGRERHDEDGAMGGEGSAEESEAGAPPEGDSDLERFAGTYSLQPWHGEAVVLPWKDGLAMVGLPTNDPLGSLEELRRVEPEGGNRFRRVREDGELGETIVFEEDEDGRIVAFVQHSNRYPRVD